MCGRFVQKASRDVLATAFPGVLFPGELSGPPRYNVAPSQPLLVVPNDGTTTARAMTWGLVPHWARDPKGPQINARSETAGQQPFFRDALRSRRCLVFADGFYEWQGKAPHFFALADGRPFAFAAIFDVWRAPGGAGRRGVALLTTAANDVVRPVHDRMPVLLPRAAFGAWLDPGEADPRELAPLLRPAPPATMRSWPVSPLVNSPKNDRPELIAPAAA